MYEILKSTLEGLKAGSDKIKIIDHNTVLYIPSSIEMYMRSYKTVFTRGGEIIGMDDDLDLKELAVIFSIRGIINPQEDILSRRKKMIEHFNAKEVAPTPEVADYSSDDDENADQFEL